MSEYAVMSLADYDSVCDTVRERLGTSEKIKSGELAEKINETYLKGFADGNIDLGELIALQENYIYQGNNDVLHIAVDENGDIYNGNGYKENVDWDNSLMCEVPKDGYCLTGFIPVSSNDTVYIKNIKMTANSGVVYFYRGTTKDRYSADPSGDELYNVKYDTFGNVIGFDIPDISESGHPYTHIRLSTECYKRTPIITKNEPIGGESV